MGCVVSDYALRFGGRAFVARTYLRDYDHPRIRSVVEDPLAVDGAAELRFLNYVSQMLQDRRPFDGEGSNDDGTALERCHEMSFSD